MKRAIFRPLWARLWASPRIYIALLCIVLATAPIRASVQELLVNNILGLYNQVRSGAGLFTFAVCILPAFSFSSVYAEDETNGVIPQWSIRCGIRRYAIAFYGISLLAGFLTVLLGFWCMFGFLTVCGVPLVGEVPTGNGPYKIFVERGQPLLYLLLSTIDSAIGGAVMAGLGALVGTYTRNRLAAAASPLMLYMLMVRLNAGFPRSGIWRYLRISELVETATAPDPATGMLVKLLYLIILGGLFGVLTVRKIERRQQNA